MDNDFIGPPLPEIVSRKDAIARGLSQYFTGKPCKRGHLTARHPFSRECIACRIADRQSQEGRKRDAQYRKEYRTKHPEPAQAKRNRATYMASYRKANPDILAAWKRNRRARKSSAEGRHTAADILRIYHAQRGRCAYCRERLGRSYHVDHIVPLARGGSNWPRNIQLLCAPCNVSKKASDPIDHMQSLGRLL